MPHPARLRHGGQAPFWVVRQRTRSFELAYIKPCHRDLAAAGAQGSPIIANSIRLINELPSGRRAPCSPASQLRDDHLLRGIGAIASGEKMPDAAI